MSPPRNLAASVRDRLRNLATARGEDFNLILTRFFLERLLYRLSISPHADRFTLKGAFLFTVWEGEPHRATRDLDLLGRGDNSTPAKRAGRTTGTGRPRPLQPASTAGREI